MISIPIPSDKKDYAAFFTELLRRAPDGTVVPLFVDYTNQRVIIGSTVSTGSGAAFQIQSGDLEITSSAKGIVVQDANGTDRRARIRAYYDTTTSNWYLDVSSV